MIHLVFLFHTDDKSTLFVAFRVLHSKRDSYRRRDFLESRFTPMSHRVDTASGDPIKGIMMKKLTSFPTAPKLVVTPTWNTCPSKELEEIPECLHVEYEGGKGALSTIREVVSKRWQTLDLISIIKEAQRTVAKNGGNRITKITDNLSTIPRFEPTPEQS